MKKTQKLLIGVVVFSSIFLFSSADLSAQPYKTGSDAQTVLVAEYTTIKSAITSPFFEWNRKIIYR